MPKKPINPYLLYFLMNKKRLRKPSGGQSSKEKAIYYLLAVCFVNCRSCFLSAIGAVLVAKLADFCGVHRTGKRLIYCVSHLRGLGVVLRALGIAAVAVSRCGCGFAGGGVFAGNRSGDPRHPEKSADDLI